MFYLNDDLKTKEMVTVKAAEFVGEGVSFSFFDMSLKFKINRD